jgi:tRNA 2-thiouridine synthesizing protein A
MSLNDEGLNVRKLNICGKVCPMTFIYTKLALEEMETNEILEVLLDFPDAIDNVTNSCKRQELAELIEVKEIPSNKKTWRLLFRKM